MSGKLKYGWQIGKKFNIHQTTSKMKLNVNRNESTKMFEVLKRKI